MVGKAASQHPALVRQVARAGHEIGNHSWDHRSFPSIGGRQRRAQIRACAKALAPYGRRIFRPPYGHQSFASRLDALWLGYQVVTWQFLAYDWLDRDAEWITDHLLTHIGPGAIVLLHDTLYTAMDERYRDRSATLTAVDALLRQLGDRFSFLTVSDLLQHGQIQYQGWYRRAEPEREDRLLQGQHMPASNLEDL
jgi:peptidoglycan/xylan/chitin deacetylase (PgdA/CDA1 family)